MSNFSFRKQLRMTLLNRCLLHHLHAVYTQHVVIFRGSLTRCTMNVPLSRPSDIRADDVMTRWESGSAWPEDAALTILSRWSLACLAASSHTVSSWRHVRVNRMANLAITARAVKLFGLCRTKTNELCSQVPGHAAKTWIFDEHIVIELRKVQWLVQHTRRLLL